MLTELGVTHVYYENDHSHCPCDGRRLATVRPARSRGGGDRFEPALRGAREQGRNAQGSAERHVSERLRQLGRSGHRSPLFRRGSFGQDIRTEALNGDKQTTREERNASSTNGKGVPLFRRACAARSRPIAWN